MRPVLSDLITGKYIICSCEGTSEESIIDLLLDNGKLWFIRCDLVDEKITRIRTGDKIAQEFLGREYSKDIVILRIIDREKDSFKLPRAYTLNRKIPDFAIVTKPEIEILHIIAEGMIDEYARRRKMNKLMPSEFCKSIGWKNVKKKEFIENMYGNNVDKLISAIERYSRRTDYRGYGLKDLLVM